MLVICVRSWLEAFDSRAALCYLHWPEFWRNWKMLFCCGFSRSILWMLKKLQKQLLSTKNGGHPWCHSSRMGTFLSLKSLGSSMPRSYTCKDKTKQDIPFLSCLDETMFPTRRISKSFKVCTNKWISVEERSILDLSVEFTGWSMSYSHIPCLWISCHRWSLLHAFLRSSLQRWSRCKFRYWVLDCLQSGFVVYAIEKTIKL